MVTAIHVRTWWERPEPLPFDFIGTKHYVKKLSIIEMREGQYVSHSGGLSPSAVRVITSPAYFIYVMTEFGDLCIDVSEAVYELLEIGDQIVVSYQHGRWTGALKGEIAS